MPPAEAAGGFLAVVSATVAGSLAAFISADVARSWHARNVR